MRSFTNANVKVEDLFLLTWKLLTVQIVREINALNVSLIIQKISLVKNISVENKKNKMMRISFNLHLQINTRNVHTVFTMLKKPKVVTTWFVILFSAKAKMLFVMFVE